MNPDVVAEHEWLHPPGDDPTWQETWSFDLVDEHATLGVHIAVTRHPAERRAWYWAAVVRPGRPTVVVRELDVVLPPRPTLELRHEGLWADHVCEEPGERWSLGLEAFGVALDDPADAWHGELGHRTPVGADLEWEDDPGSHRPLDRLGSHDGHHAICHAHGELLVGAETIEVDAAGTRSHRWGPADWSAGVAIATARPDASVDHVQIDDRGLLRSASVTGGEGATAWTAAAVGWAPLLIDAGPTRSRLDRALCRLTAPDEPPGSGWIERRIPSSVP